MNGFVLRFAISALGLWVASALVPGVHINGGWTLVIAALLLGIVNALVRPIVLVLTFPFTLITLGLFILVVNAAMFALVAAFLDGFRLSGFWAALFGALVVSITSWIASSFIGPRGRYEVIVMRRD
ncbi:MAG TPA: phage holin family protein [Pseudomonadales bacterium]